MSQDQLNKSKVLDPKVIPRAKRRRFSDEYKLGILEDVDGRGLAAAFTGNAAVGNVGVIHSGASSRSGKICLARCFDK